MENLHSVLSKSVNSLALFIKKKALLAIPIMGTFVYRDAIKLHHCCMVKAKCQDADTRNIIYCSASRLITFPPYCFLSNTLFNRRLITVAYETIVS